ncbi:MAG: hypothetical protein ABMA13_07615 [Chthoniobacteraceae bacterium]
MKCSILALATLALAASATFAAEPPRKLDKAKALPLAIDDAFQFRKTKTFLYDPRDPRLNQPALDPMIAFERQRIAYGAVNQVDRRQRYGHYYDFFWRTDRPSDVTVRFEYRQQNLGAYVQAREVEYKAVKGSVKTSFTVIGDDYDEEGKVTAWRAIIIENGKVVALNQSFLWN